MEANILVDGYFAGEPIEVDLFPPPAAISRARLVVEEPSKEDAALNVDYKISKSSNHVTLTFSAQPRVRSYWKAAR